VSDDAKVDRSALRDRIGNACFVGALLLLWFVGPLVPGARYMDAIISRHAAVLLIVTIAVGAGGLIVLLSGLTGLIFV